MTEQYEEQVTKKIAYVSHVFVMAVAYSKARVILNQTKVQRIFNWKCCNQCVFVYLHAKNVNTEQFHFQTSTRTVPMTEMQNIRCYNSFLLQNVRRPSTSGYFHFTTTKMQQDSFTVTICTIASNAHNS